MEIVLGILLVAVFVVAFGWKQRHYWGGFLESDQKRQDAKRARRQATLQDQEPTRSEFESPPS